MKRGEFDGARDEQVVDLNPLVLKNPVLNEDGQNGLDGASIVLLVEGPTDK